MKSCQFLVSGALALLLAGCLTPAREKTVGAEQAAKVEAEMGLVEAPVPLEYVRAVAMRLTAVSDRPEGPWSLEIVDAPEPNAFALPGGHLYVTRGLLAIVNSEDELAGVIGHEIGHVTGRHHAKQLRAAVLTAPVTLASAIAGLAGGLVSPLLRDAVTGTGKVLTGGLVLAPYGRAQETEADQIGQALAARAGYDPAALASFLRTLDREVALLTDQKRRFHFLDTHPAAADRAARTEARAATLTQATGRRVVASKAELFAKLDGLLVGADPKQGVFRDARFLHPGMDLVVDFPEGWETANTPTAAGAVSPAKDAVVALRFVAADTTLDTLLEEALKAQPDLGFERGSIRGLPVARTRHDHRGQSADITLLGYRGDVLAIVGHCQTAAFDRFEEDFSATAGSFRALRASERRSIQEARLRVRSSRAGETLEAFVKRTGSTWSAAQLAVANGLAPDEALPTGLLLKVAVPEPYSR